MDEDTDEDDDGPPVLIPQVFFPYPKGKERLHRYEDLWEGAQRYLRGTSFAVISKTAGIPRSTLRDFMVRERLVKGEARERKYRPQSNKGPGSSKKKLRAKKPKKRASQCQFILT